jgi:hypothetical protein
MSKLYTASHVEPHAEVRPKLVYKNRGARHCCIELSRVLLASCTSLTSSVADSGTFNILAAPELTPAAGAPMLVPIIDDAGNLPNRFRGSGNEAM